MNTLTKRSSALAFVVLAACATVPTGPSQYALPGTGKSYAQFNADDAACRQAAYNQVAGVTPGQAATDSAVKSAAVGTAVGAAAGALIDGSHGAGVGAGMGLVAGSLIGLSTAQGSYYSSQSRYDYAYKQCMYAKGHKVPVPASYARSYQRSPGTRSAAPYPPPPNAPPPTAGAPPPNAAIPPPDAPPPR